jgi:asparagine synthase (glutamine-hydrolysing)
MSGIAGIARSEPIGVRHASLRRMAAALRHRGPDGHGYFVGQRVGFAHTRLSITDSAGSAQPLANEDDTVIVVFDGEIYNHQQLREELMAKGHRFRSISDTEVLVHAYEQWGEAMLPHLDGQFAFAVYDKPSGSVLLARDRFGARPLFYAIRSGTLLFASEVKALLASGEVDAAPDLHGLHEVFTFWAARPPRTPFAGVSCLEPGCSATWRQGRLRSRRYYDLRYHDADVEPRGAVGTLDDLIRAAVKRRMRADVPVGSYLSGGVDSSIICALAAAESPHALRTFSVTFDDPRFDESAHQHVIVDALGSHHASVHIRPGDIASVFPDVVLHAETPLLRTAPAPLFLLSRLAREHGISGVLSGEGSDELFLGYDLFKETKIRQFCMRQPQSRLRPRLFDRIYPHQTAGGRGEFWRRFFLEPGAPDDVLFSHMPRFLLTSRIKDFYASHVRAELAGADPLAELRQSLPLDFAHWSTLNRAAYLEIVTLLQSYVLSSQGDRMTMAHGVEGRFPFLDHRLFEFSASLPTGSKLRGLREKEILRRWAKQVVPARVLERGKQPYCAPDIPAFFDGPQPEYVGELLSSGALRGAGYFDPVAVDGLVRRCRRGHATGVAESQALLAVLSTQIWHQRFIKDAAPPARLDHPDVVLVEETAAESSDPLFAPSFA